jgi:hypothetical protein
VATHQQSRPPGTGIRVEHGSEDRVRDGGRHPPAPEPSGRQVRESRGSGQNQLPRRQFFELRTAQTRGVYPSSDAFPFPAPQPSPGGRAWSALYRHAGSMGTRTVIVRACSTSVDGPRCSLPPVETDHSPPASGRNLSPPTWLLAKPVSRNPKTGQIRVGGDRLPHVEDWRAKPVTFHRLLAKPVTRHPPLWKPVSRAGWK